MTPTYLYFMKGVLMTSYNHPDNSLLTGNCRLVLPELVQQGVKIQSCTTSLP